MAKRKLYFLFLLLGFLSSWMAQAAWSHKTGTVSSEADRDFRLRQGEIFTDGQYVKEGIFATMEGVIEAPPDLVWRLYIHANDWMTYAIPTLLDSRFVDDDVVKKVENTKNVHDVYKALTARNQTRAPIINPTQERRTGVSWDAYVFQYYNVPWPLSNRWMINKVSYDESKHAEKIYRAVSTRFAGNIKTMRDEIIFTSFDGDPRLTRLQYKVTTHPGSFVPKFLLKWGVKKTMPDVIQAIRRQVKKKMKEPKPLLKI